ncbi:MAG: endolytic transglycosylase MltG [Faecalibacterium prausnitzii]
MFRNRLAEGSPYPKLQSNTSSHVQSDADNNYLWNWVAPYYGGWDSIPENILEAYDTYTCTGLSAGPISNPGIAAIRAALAPQPDDEAKDAYFFVTDRKETTTTPAPTQTIRKTADAAAKVNKSNVKRGISCYRYRNFWPRQAISSACGMPSTTARTPFTALCPSSGCALHPPTSPRSS